MVSSSEMFWFKKKVRKVQLKCSRIINAPMIQVSLAAIQIIKDILWKQQVFMLIKL